VSISQRAASFATEYEVLKSSVSTASRRFRSCGKLFAPAPAGQQGDFGRKVLRGFDATQADLGVQPIVRVTEKEGLRLRGEFFNILNHPNFGSPTNSLTSSLFGRSTSTLANFLGSGGANGGFNPLYQIGGPRSVQLALKLIFCRLNSGAQYPRR
jgi:hypothetical protein